MKNSNNVFSGNVNKTYLRVDRGEGAILFDEKGKKYIDCAAGVAVANIGHGVTEVIDAIYEQGRKISYVYGATFSSEARERLASQIIELAPEGMEKVFFCSGGSEAVESIIKIARQYNLERGKTGKYKVISRWQSYHGNTIATLSVGGRPIWREKYEPLLLHMPHISQCNCYRCPFGKDASNCGYLCAEELERVIKFEGPDTVSAFLLEPIVGTTAAALVPPQGYLKRVREICDKYDILLCADEVITAFGRTGANFAVDHFNIAPDMIAVAKGLGGGYVPIGAVIVSQKVVDAFRKGSGALMHSFTYAGNPVTCAGASAVLKYLVDNNLIKASAVKGEFFLKTLKEKIGDLPIVGDIRGKGLLLGVEFVKDRKTKEPFDAKEGVCAKIAEFCFAKGLMVVSGIPGSNDGITGDAMQISPPFVIEEKEMAEAAEILQAAIKNFLG